MNPLRNRLLLFDGPASTAGYVASMLVIFTLACSLPGFKSEDAAPAPVAAPAAPATAPAVPAAKLSPRQGPAVETAADLPGVLVSLHARRDRLAAAITASDATTADEEARGIAADIAAAGRFTSSKAVSTRMQSATSGTALRRATLEAVMKLKKGDGAGASAQMGDVDKELAAFEKALSAP